MQSGKVVFCKKLNKELPGLASQPYPGELGKKIFESISQQAWQDWMKHQTMLINENRLNVLDPEAKKLLVTEMEKFLFEK